MAVDRLRDRAAVAVSRWNRRRKARVVSGFISARGVMSALIVGCGEGWYPESQIVEAAIVQRVPFLVAIDLWERSWAPWRYVRGSGLSLPFADKSFDLVISNAVIEHVGDEVQQRRFVAEHVRVGKSWIITTPNRWFPVESHTRVAFRHWYARWRAAQTEFTRLLSIGEFRRLLPAGSVVKGTPASPTFVGASHALSINLADRAGSVRR